MKALIIGGKYQGKKQFAMDTFGLNAGEIYTVRDKKEMDSASVSEQKVIYGFHLLVKQWLKAGQSPEEETEKLNAKVIISDEIGGGIIPTDPFERQWREATGRCCCILALKAEQVIRVYCGLGQVIK